MANLYKTFTELAIILFFILFIGQVNEIYEEYKRNKILKIPITGYVLSFITILILLYSFIYKPYFTTMGQIRREIKMQEKALYYVCGLPEDNKLYLKLLKECNELKLRSEY